MKPRGMETGRGEVERASRASLRGGTVPRAIRARRERGALEADGLVRAGKEVGIGLHAVQVRIEDGRDRHHHALLEELRRSRRHVRYYKMLSSRLRASAFAQRRARRGVRDEHATGRTHNQTARVRGCWGYEARAGGSALEDRNALRRRPCWLRQLLLERSDRHRPDQVFWQREVRQSGAAHRVSDCRRKAAQGPEGGDSWCDASCEMIATIKFLELCRTIPRLELKVT